MPTPPANELGAYLRDRRSKLDPHQLGLTASRRRTPGLRREEVAQRANISTTWYTWLEQGRGGAPSAELLDRLARALILTDAERDHLFHLALGRPPQPRYQDVGAITPRLQRIMDRLVECPCLVRTATWDILAWNRAAAALFGDYSQLEPAQRNVLRLMFSHGQSRTHQADWESVARFVVASFRSETTKAGAIKSAQTLVEELCQTSQLFKTIWEENDVQGHGGGLKRLHHPIAGEITMEYSDFAVDGRPDLKMVVYNPVHAQDAARLRALVADSTKPLSTPD